MNLDTKVPCPACGSRKNKQIPGHQLECLKCHATHDGKPNEHGRALHHDPQINLEKMERAARFAK